METTQADFLRIQYRLLKPAHNQMYDRWNIQLTMPYFHNSNIQYQISNIKISTWQYRGSFSPQPGEGRRSRPAQSLQIYISSITYRWLTPPPSLPKTELDILTPSPCSVRQPLPPWDWEATLQGHACLTGLPARVSGSEWLWLKWGRLQISFSTSWRGRSPVQLSSHKLAPASTSSFLEDAIFSHSVWYS